MIGYVNIGTNDFAKATSFYDDLLGTIGAVRVFEVESFVAWSTGASAPALSISRPFDGGEATVGNGVMVALGVETPEQVEQPVEEVEEEAIEELDEDKYVSRDEFDSKIAELKDLIESMKGDMGKEKEMV